MHHLIDILLADRQIISRIILSLLTTAQTLYIDLVCALERCYLTINLDIIQCIIITDPHTVRIPDLCVDRACFVLQHSSFVWLTIFGSCQLLMLAKINV